jgi:hypothetical protein
MPTEMRFVKGDHIRVTDTKTGAVMTGTAMNTRGFTGFAEFYFRPDGTTSDISLNLNYWSVEVLFSADVARVTVRKDWTAED